MIGRGQLAGGLMSLFAAAAAPLLAGLGGIASHHRVC